MGVIFFVLLSFVGGDYFSLSYPFEINLAELDFLGVARTFAS